ncbi:MAG: hypothetical protein ACR2JY_18635 [Chloroflexota bacterium]
MLTLEDLSQGAFAAFGDAAARVPEVVVKPAIPILFFGDIESFRGSPVRVVTVGLNPSRAEFPPDRPLARFPAAAGLRELNSTRDSDRYVAALSNYFREDPYRAWFATYDGLLEGLDASFNDGCANTALHTDICSPVATNPTWSRLVQSARAALMPPGLALWHDLIRLLQPHVLLVSVARSYLATIEFAADSEWAELHRIERTNPYIVRHQRLRLGDGTTTALIFCQAAEKPFGLVGKADQRQIGASVRRLLGV